MEKVHAASTALGKRKLEVVRGFLEELDSDIKKRNKLIRLTDKSAAGWDLVSEYFLDELASAFDVQSIVSGTEQRALRKRKDRQQHKGKSTVKQSQPSATTTSFAGQHINSTSGPLLAPLRLLAKQNLARFVSRAVSKVIGGPSAGLSHNSGPQVLAGQILVSPEACWR